MQLLVDFPNLKRVDLPDAANLALGFDGGHWCGNAYFDYDGSMYLRQVTEDGAEATTKGGDIVVSTLPDLPEFSIGWRTPIIRRKGDGTAKVIWPWSGRMNQWLDEEVPGTATGVAVRDDKASLIQKRDSR